MLAEADPVKALEFLTSTVEGYQETSYRYVLPSLLLTRAQVLRHLDRDPEAEADLREAIEEVERQRSEVGTSQHRVAFFDEAQEIFEELVLLFEEQGYLDQALAFDEAARARVLFDWIQEANSSRQTTGSPSLDTNVPLEVVDLLEELPPGTAVIQLRVFKERLLIWVLRLGKIERIWVEITGAEVGRLSRELRRVIQDQENSTNLERAGADLFSAVVEPAQAMLDGISHLVFVPHGPLHGVPFAALFEPTRGRYLIEDYVLSVAPSSSAFLHAVRRGSGPMKSALFPALVIGDPTLDPVLFPLPPLEAARQEAEEVAALYSPGSRLFLREAATRRAFLAHATDAAVIHIAAHAQPNSEVPLASRLLLARDGEKGDGSLEVQDLLGLDLSSTRLVVLSACATALGSSSKSEGTQNLARPFLAAGVPAVVATLWNIDDRAATTLMVRLHQYLLTGQTASEALRKVQLKAMAETDNPANTAVIWAAFGVWGGG